MLAQYLTGFHDYLYRLDPGSDLTIDGRASRLYVRLLPWLLTVAVVC